MIADEKLSAFLHKAAEIRGRNQPADIPPGADPRGLVDSDQVFTQLAWPVEDTRYFQDDDDNLVRELEYQGSVVIWHEGRPVGAPATPTAIAYTFQLTDKGLAQTRRR